MTNQKLEDQYVIKDNKKMRFGYTTGSCAAAAAQAATQMLLSREDVPVVKLDTPKGITLFLEPQEAKWNAKEASCAIRKDAGDDPDVTNGILVYATVARAQVEEGEPKLQIKGGIGVGVVTKPGLEQPIGAPAINRVPREMIIEAVERVCKLYGYTGALTITISVPEGVEIAKQTFNPRLGIEGGISILGTSGIVEPMSEKALVRTIEVEMRQKTSNGRKYLLITPGNYGTKYLNDNFPFGPDEAVKCSNYVGQTLDLAVNIDLKGLLFVAHVGKFAKVAGGIMNTHSKEADSRMEILSSCAIRAGAPLEVALEMLDSVTTDDALKVIYGTQYWDESMRILLEKVAFYLNHRTYGRLETGAILFSNVYGELGRTAKVPELIGRLQNQE